MFTEAEMFASGRYELLEVMGITPSSTLHRARTTGREELLVVIEVFAGPLAEGPGFLELLRAEAPAALAFRHSAAAAVREVWLGEGRAETDAHVIGVASDALPGRSLRSVLERAEAARRALPVGLVLQVALVVADLLWALERAPWRDGASAGMSLGSLSAERVLVDAGGVVRVAEVGLARARAKLPPSPYALAWRAPERVDDPSAVGAHADLYALGMLMYDLLFGRAVHLREDLEETGLAVKRGARPRLARVRGDVDANLEALVEWLVAASPRERPPTVQAVLGMLADALRRSMEVATLKTGAFMTQLFSVSAFRGDLRSARRTQDPPPVESLGPRADAAEEPTTVLAPAPTPLPFVVEPVVVSAVAETGDLVLPAPSAAPLPGASRAGAAGEPGLEALRRKPLVTGGWVEPVDLLIEPAVEADGRAIPLEAVGSGGWRRGFERATGREVLLEPLPPHAPEALEARVTALSQLERHPFVLPFIGAYPEPLMGCVVSLSELRLGVPLADRVAASGPLEIAEVVRLLEQVLDGLTHLHLALVAHGALDPAAILVRGAGSRLECDIAGLLRAVGPTGGPPGPFRAPEVAEGEAPSLAADVFSVGAVAHFALLGVAPPPLSRGELGAGGAWVSRAPAERQAAQRLYDVVRLALEPSLGRRPSHAAALREVLLSGRIPRASGSGSGGRAERDPRGEGSHCIDPG